MLSDLSAWARGLLASTLALWVTFNILPLMATLLRYYLGGTHYHDWRKDSIKNIWSVQTKSFQPNSVWKVNAPLCAWAWGLLDLTMCGAWGSKPPGIASVCMGCCLRFNQNLNHVCASNVMFVVSFPSPSVLLGGPLIIATNYFEGNLNYFFLPLSSLLLLLVAALLSLPSGGVFVDTTRH